MQSISLLMFIILYMIVDYYCLFVKCHKFYFDVLRSLH